MKKHPTQSSFATDERYSGLAAGAYSIAYTDGTHLEPTDWRELLSIDLNAPAELSQERERSFQMTVSLDKKFESKEKGKERYGDIVTDVLSLSATRLGLVSPLIVGRTADQLLELKKSKGIVLIPDTNSLYNGTLHWLLNVLRESSVWLLPFVMSLTQMQAREATLKGMLRTRKEGNLPQALRSRALVNAGLSLLERNHHRYQVMELDPSLLRYMRTAGKGGFDQDEGEVLEDRLLIEGVHSILRSTRTRATQVVVTSDVLLARVLSAEGIENICLPTPRLDGSSIGSVRYDAWARTYVGTTLRALVWDLAHAFGSVKLVAGNKDRFHVGCYWPGKLPQDWLDERLDVFLPEVPKVESLTTKDAAPITSQAIPPAKAAKKTPAEKTVKASVVAKNEVDTLPTDPSFSNAALPQSSFPLALKVASVIYNEGKVSADDLLTKFPADGRPAKGNVWRSLEILRRCGFVDFDGKTISSTPELDALDSNLRSARLDDVSSQMVRFRPYEIVLEHLKANGTLDREVVHGLLEGQLEAPVALEASMRLVRFHVLLGQCWTDGKVWRDGSMRPNEQSFVNAFGAVFDRVVHDNIARISDFLPELCRETRMSPWAAERAAQQSARRLSADYSFQYGLGGKPASVDQIVVGSLVTFSEVAVPLDRIEIGGRPVLTLGRVKS